MTSDRYFRATAAFRSRRDKNSTISRQKNKLNVDQ